MQRVKHKNKHSTNLYTRMSAQAIDDEINNVFYFQFLYVKGLVLISILWGELISYSDLPLNIDRPKIKLCWKTGFEHTTNQTTKPSQLYTLYIVQIKPKRMNIRCPSDILFI